MTNAILASDSDKCFGLSKHAVFKILQHNSKLSSRCRGPIDSPEIKSQKVTHNET